VKIDCEPLAIGEVWSHDLPDWDVVGLYPGFIDSVEFGNVDACLVEMVV
jgi:hypothetical protein